MGFYFIFDVEMIFFSPIFHSIDTIFAGDYIGIAIIYIIAFKHFFRFISLTEANSKFIRYINLNVFFFLPFSQYLFRSFDVRGRKYGQAKLWSSPLWFSSRAYFSTVTQPAQLKVENIKLSDEGMYRCRVDFKNSPTRNLKINLTVIGE